MLLLFSNPSFYTVFAYISIFCLCPPYRNMTSPYGPKIHNLSFFQNLHFIWFLPIFQFLVNALPNRMMTSPYKLKIHNLSLFCQPFILYCFCLDFNFSSMPSLLEYDQPLYFFFRLLWFAAQWRSTSCHSRKTIAFPL